VGMAIDEREALPRALFWSLLFVPFGFWVAFTFGYSVDDALITVRYAANIAHGHGPVFNPGERVEGFSSPIHLLVQVVLWPIPGGHELLRTKLASVAFGFLTVFLAGRLLQQFRLPRWAVVLACLLVSTNWMLAFGSANGLETTLVAALTTWLLLYLVRGDAITHPWRTGVVAAALALSRPEAIAMVAVLGLCALLTGDRAQPSGSGCGGRSCPRAPSSRTWPSGSSTTASSCRTRTTRSGRR
jgi:phosphatidylserine synthase